MACKTLSFNLMGQPVPWARSRQSGKRHFTSKKVSDYKDALRWAAVGQERTFFEGPVRVDLTVHIGIPKSWSKKKQKECHNFHPGRPDLDNYIKIVLDAMNDIVWNDDAQVQIIHAEKYYNKLPKIVVLIREL